MNRNKREGEREGELTMPVSLLKIKNSMSYRSLQTFLFLCLLTPRLVAPPSPHKKPQTSFYCWMTVAPMEGLESPISIMTEE